MTIESISAITLATRSIARAVSFYEAIGCARIGGSAETGFVSFRIGGQFLNLQQVDGASFGGWGRVILYVADVDEMYRRVVSCGFSPEFAPRDAAWGERYFHLRDPDGHELSFARPLGK